MKKVLFIVVILFGCFLYSKDFNCFSIIVGKKASYNGSVILAHNEDNKAKQAFVNIHCIPTVFHKKDKFHTLRNGGVVPLLKKSFGFLWIQMPNSDFSDAYFNENGVSITSNECLSREKNGEFTAGGIGFMLRRLAAERAESAYQAIQIIGRLINKHGYYSSGRTLCIADKNEGWILHIVKGKHWIAQRVPDDEVAVIPNYYTIKTINLKDDKNFLGSADIFSYAKKKEWYNPEKDGEFEFDRVYSDPENYKSMVNILRQWRATNLLAKEKFKVDEPLPFSFIPRRKIRISDCFKVLRDHYEDTEFDLSNYYRNGSPNTTKNRTICTKSTQYSFVAEMRSELPQKISYLVWVALGRPDSNAYSPWYFLISSPPSGYTKGSSTDALETHFSKAKPFFKFDPNYAFCQYAKLSDLVDQDYRNRIKKTRKEWRNFENYVLKNIRKKEKEFNFLYKRNPTIARKIITNYIHNLEYRKWYLATELIREITNR